MLRLIAAKMFLGTVDSISAVGLGKPGASDLFQPQTERRPRNNALSSIDVHEGQSK
jgi:hypothetical protein